MANKLASQCTFIIIIVENLVHPVCLVLVTRFRTKLYSVQQHPIKNAI